jgi:predicted small integral membrane protein
VFTTTIAIRAAQISLVGCIALLYGLIAVNNIVDYETNFSFVAHVLQMDTTLRHEATIWRAINNSSAHHLTYILIIAWEVLMAALCGVGTVRLGAAFRQDSDAFRAAKCMALWGLCGGWVLWLGGFLAVGGEWFVMWQSADWNGQVAAFRMFAVTTLGFIVLVQSDEPPSPPQRVDVSRES